MTEQLPKYFSNSHCEKCETGTQYIRDVWSLSVCAPPMHLSQSSVGVHLFSTVGCRRGVKCRYVRQWALFFPDYLFCTFRYPSIHLVHHYKRACFDISGLLQSFFQGKM